MSAFDDKSSSVKFMFVPKLSGIVPVKLFFHKYKTCRTRSPLSESIQDQNLQLPVEVLKVRVQTLKLEGVHTDLQIGEIAEKFRDGAVEVIAHQAHELQLLKDLQGVGQHARELVVRKV